MKAVRCIICDTKGNWENVDKYTSSENGLHICKTCAFCYYPEKYKTEKEAKAHYKEDYRPPPNINNLYTGERKLHYHAHFLKELFEEWLKEKKEPKICEIGAAYGMVLNWIRGIFPKAKLSGTEYTLSFRRNAYHEYGINLDLDFDKSKKYDMIMSYKVLEHQLDADLRLREYVECLKQNGKMYISVPCWFERMTNFGVGGFDLGYYYHPDHINVWSKHNFENLLKKVGLKIIKEDHSYYDETYLCVRDDSLMKEKLIYDEPMIIKEKMDSIKKAFNLFNERKLKESIEAFPDFPLAHINYYEQCRARVHADGGIQAADEQHISPAMNACPNNSDIYLFAADIYMRYERYEDAIKYLKIALKLKPESTGALTQLSHCFNQKAIMEADINKRLQYFKNAQEIMRHIKQTSMQNRSDAVNWIYKLNSYLPCQAESNDV